MKVLEKLIHLLIPRESNNHKAKILHSSSLLVIAILFTAFQGIIGYISKIRPDVLGYASNISIQEVVNLTNQKRTEAGLSALSLNEKLSAAAYTKGRDMIDRDYWAHVAPDGTQPWKFFTNFGYKYRYAGENLARDFSNASDAVNAWMNSPTHRENILNTKYKEIGIGVVEGDLAGSDTTVIVQFFGATYADKVVQPLAQAVKTEEKVVKIILTPLPIPVKISEPEVQAVVSSPKSQQEVLISPFTTTRNASLIIVSILLLIFVVDAFLVSKRRIARIAGRTFAHVIFLFMILTIMIILKSGKII
ncbi:MAG: hypothetical protein ACD_26C00034G0105 [uncultured bacterium]|nr:MAG: hypothetical protein ACD_26C00034G0105 [uncultured bacterium]